jgi:hypothetical protein
MTIKVKKFGKYLLTRSDARALLQGLDAFSDTLVLDFNGVAIANHPFADELGKGLINGIPSCDLAKIALVGANSYVKNCVEAGFSSAVDH